MLLDTYLQELHDTKCSFQIPAEEVREIETFVLFIVRKFLPMMVKTITSRNGRQFSIEEVVCAGSYFEKTKIRTPDEFDFMIILKEMSNELAVTIGSGCRHGYANVKVSEPGSWYSAHKTYTPEKEFQITLLSFNAYLRQAIAEVPELEGKYGSLTYKDVHIRGKPYSVFSHVQTAYFIWNRHPHIYRGREPLGQDYAEIEVCVDMMTCCGLPLCMFREILPQRSLTDQALIQNGCHIVLKSCENDECVQNETDCRLISYTKSEVERMVNLDENWKTVYKCGKLLFTYLGYTGIDSYKLKTIILHLSSNRGHVEIGRGFIMLLTSLYTSAENKYLNCYFNETLNVWSISENYRYFLKWQILLLLKIFKNFQHLPDTQFNHAVLNNILSILIESSCKYASEINENRGVLKHLMYKEIFFWKLFTKWNQT